MRAVCAIVDESESLRGAVTYMMIVPSSIERYRSQLGPGGMLLTHIVHRASEGLISRV